LEYADEASIRAANIADYGQNGAWGVFNERVREALWHHNPIYADPKVQLASHSAPKAYPPLCIRSFVIREHR